MTEGDNYVVPDYFIGSDKNPSIDQRIMNIQQRSSIVNATQLSKGDLDTVGPSIPSAFEITLKAHSQVCAVCIGGKINTLFAKTSL